MPPHEPPLTKTAFVRSLPATLQPAQIVERARELGFSITRAQVRSVRRELRRTRTRSVPSLVDGPMVALADAEADADAKAEAETVAQPAPPSAPRVPRPKLAPGAKRAFVLSYPSRAPASEIIAGAAARGIAIGERYVVTVRASAAREARAKAIAGARAAQQAAEATTKADRAPETETASFQRALVANGNGSGQRNADDRVAAHAKPSPPRSQPTAALETPQPLTPAERLLLETALRELGLERAIQTLHLARERITTLFDD